jgi:hypothetical protein
MITKLPGPNQANHPDLWNPAPTRCDNRAQTLTAP